MGFLLALSISQRALTRSFLAGGLVGALAGFLFAWESLARNPGIASFGDRLLTLLFFPVLFGLAGGLIGFVADLLTTPFARTRAVAPIAAAAAFALAEGMARSYSVHQWYKDTWPSLTLTPGTSFRNFCVVVLICLVIGALVGAFVSWLLPRLRGAGAVALAFALGLPSAWLIVNKTETFQPPRYDASMQDDRDGRLFLFVIDGADWDFLMPLIESGRVPNLASLYTSGVSGELAISYPCISPYLWTSISTGLDDDQHGLCEFFAYRPPFTNALITRYPGLGTGKRFLFQKFVPKLARLGIGSAVHASRAQKRVPELWDYTSAGGITAAVVGWRFSYPAPAIEGAFVTDRFQETVLPQPAVYPAELRETLRIDFSAEGARRARPILGERLANMTTEELGMNAEKVQKLGYHLERDFRYSAATSDLIDAYDPRLVVAGLTAVDACEHQFILEHVLGREGGEVPGREGGRRALSAYFERFTDEATIADLAGTIDEVYAITDSLIGNILAARRPGDIVMVVSDHGHDLDGSGHRFGPGGIIMMAGAGIHPAGRLEGARVYDVLPTALYALGLPVPHGLAGTVLIDAFEEKTLADHPISLVFPSEGDHQEVRTLDALPELGKQDLEELRALGYVD